MLQKYDEPINYKQLTDEEKEELKVEMFNIFCELKKSFSNDVKPKNIADEVLKRYNIIISPQTIKAIWRIEKWDKKVMIGMGLGLTDSINETVIDDRNSVIKVRAYERELLRSMKIFMNKRFTELQTLADKIYGEIQNKEVLSKDFWKGLMNYLAIHDKQIKMLEVIGVDKIMGELLQKEEHSVDMEKIIELYEVAQQNAEIIKQMIEREEGKLIDAEVINDGEQN